MRSIRIQVPEKARRIIDGLFEEGYEAYVVGGCVRDSILGRTPQDWDITTSARPEQVKALFPRTVDTGIQHGTVTVLLGGEGYEVTTYRIDGKYEDGRHPVDVTFTPSLEEDLKRRDFTVNAMAYNDRKGLVDIFGGLGDIRDKVIRCVGDPSERFGEDALRILRALRFSAQLGYDIEKNTMEAIRRLAPELKKISAERIQAELVKLLLSPHPERLQEVYDAGVTKVFLPEFDAMMETPQRHPHHCYSVGVHTLHVLSRVRSHRVLRLAALFHDVGKPLTMTCDDDGTTHFHGHAVKGAELTQDILRRLKFDNDTIGRVCRLIFYHDYGNNVRPDIRMVRRAVNRIGEDAFPCLFDLKRADIMAQSDYMRQEKLESLALWEELYRRISDEGQCVSLKTLAVTGADLIGIGMEQGKELGVMLKKLLELVLDDPELNHKDILLAKAQDMLFKG